MDAQQIESVLNMLNLKEFSMTRILKAANRSSGKLGSQQTVKLRRKTSNIDRCYDEVFGELKL